METAVGWIAVGPVAISPFFACGAVPLGLVAMGAIPIGIIALGGVALGAVAFGGMAVAGVSIAGLAFGWIPLGGMAAAIKMAVGGVALSREFAIGGVAVGPHANDAAAREWLTSHPMVDWLANDLTQTAWLPFFWVPFLFLIPIIRIAAVGLGQRRMDPPTAAAGWITLCPRCGFARALAASGGFRAAASSYQKRTLGFCPQCRRFRWIQIRWWSPEEDAESAGPVDPE